MISMPVFALSLHTLFLSFEDILVVFVKMHSLSYLLTQNARKMLIMLHVRRFPRNTQRRNGVSTATSFGHDIAAAHDVAATSKQRCSDVIYLLWYRIDGNNEIDQRRGKSLISWPSCLRTPRIGSLTCLFAVRMINYGIIIFFLTLCI